MQIKTGDLSNKHVLTLLEEHHQDMHKFSPPESIHTLDIDALRQSNIMFWSGWIGNKLAGCVALKHLNQNACELKSMRTARTFLRQGIAKQLLIHTVDFAKAKGYQAIFLETGSMLAFEPARQLYIKHGFTYIKPFDNYVDDPNSVFMKLTLSL